MITRRRMLAATGGLAALAAAGQAPDYFTGAVRVDPLFQAPDPARARSASVTFEPGARTA